MATILEAFGWASVELLADKSCCEVLQIQKPDCVFADNITPAVKYPTVVIPACLPLRRKGAGIQKNTGCPRLTNCRGRLIKLVPDLIGDPA